MDVEGIKNVVIFPFDVAWRQVDLAKTVAFPTDTACLI